MDNFSLEKKITGLAESLTENFTGGNDTRSNTSIQGMSGQGMSSQGMSSSIMSGMNIPQGMSQNVGMSGIPDVNQQSYVEIPVDYWIYLSPGMSIAYIKLGKSKLSKNKELKLIYGKVASGLNTVRAKRVVGTYQTILLINATGFNWAFSNKDVSHLYISMDSVDLMNNTLRSNGLSPVQKSPVNLQALAINDNAQLSQSLPSSLPSSLSQQPLMMQQQLPQQLSQQLQQQLPQQLPQSMLQQPMIPQYNQSMHQSINQEQTSLGELKAEVLTLKSEIMTLKKNLQTVKDENQNIMVNVQKLWTIMRS